MISDLLLSFQPFQVLIKQHAQATSSSGRVSQYPHRFHTDFQDFPHFHRGPISVHEEFDIDDEVHQELQNVVDVRDLDFLV